MTKISRHRSQGCFSPKELQAGHELLKELDLADRASRGIPSASQPSRTPQQIVRRMEKLRSRLMNAHSGLDIPEVTLDDFSSGQKHSWAYPHASTLAGKNAVYRKALDIQGGFIRAAQPIDLKKPAPDGWRLKRSTRELFPPRSMDPRVLTKCDVALIDTLLAHLRKDRPFRPTKRASRRLYGQRVGELRKRIGHHRLICGDEGDGWSLNASVEIVS